MNPKGRYNYKALYLASVKQGAQKDELLAQKVHLIARQQQQLMQLGSDRRTLTDVISTQNKQLTEQADLISTLRHRDMLQQQIIGEHEQRSAQQQSVIKQQINLITDLKTEREKDKKQLLRMDELRHQLRTLKKMCFGIKSEKRHQPTGQSTVKAGAQLSLSMEVDSWGVCQITRRTRVPAHMRLSKSTTPKKAGGRRDFPQGLPEEITTLEPGDIPAGAKFMRYDDRRQLACDPMRWYIKVTRRPIYLVPLEDGLEFKHLIAPLPVHPIYKCKVDISVLVTLVLDKYIYHLPIWRQRQRYLQFGIDLPYSTLCSLTNRTCEALEPLWHLLLKEITVSSLIHVDETTFRVLDQTKKKGKKSHIGWMWSMMNPVQRIACFMYQPGRGKKDIASVLRGYKGYLMSDAYGAYTKYGKQPGVIHQQCLSHSRRYFMYALEDDKARASYALDHFFGSLYDIEQECKEQQLDFDMITDQRQSRSLPLLNEFRQWLRAELPKTIERTPIYKAIAYALRHFEALAKYTEDGMLQIDNNLLEGQIRALALGRRNYLFAGSHRAGELAAIIYSCMATCKLQKIDPSNWLSDVLGRISVQPAEKLIELLPQYWKPLGENKAKCV
jgi:transposase